LNVYVSSFSISFLLEGIGTYVSVVGLGAVFAYSYVVMLMAVALDIAKVTTVTFLYRHRKEIGWTMKSYMLAACLVLMMITSSGVFGYLSGEFQSAIASSSQQTVIIQTLEEEKGRLQKRKEEIDKQIAQLPQNNVRGRAQLMKQFGPEVTRLNDRLAEIDKKLPELKVANIEKNVHVGPIMYVAEAFKTTPQEAVKWVILTIIGVFDPLAIALLVAGNFLLARKKPEPEEEDLEFNHHGIRALVPNETTVAAMEEANQMVEAYKQRHADPEVPPEFEAPPQPTLQELTDKEDRRKFESIFTPEQREAARETAVEPIAQLPDVPHDLDQAVERHQQAEAREKVIIKASPKKPRALKVKESDGKEVITLTPEPPIRAGLESISSRADVESINDSTTSSNSLRTYHD
jgi:hypothetical protein